jgi:flagellar hook protein FlgE
MSQVAERIAKATGYPVDTTAGQSADSSPSSARDTVDLSSNMVALLQARNEFQTNANVVKTGDTMQKTLLNLLA